MPDEPVDIERLRRELDYYKRQLDEMAGENVRLDRALSGSRHEYKQKRQGFALLTELQQSIGTHRDIPAIFELTIGAINATLGMDKTVVLEPMDNAHHYRPNQWVGFHDVPDEYLASLTFEFPPEFSDGTGLLLVNKSTAQTPLIEEIRDALELPYFICLPVMLGNAPLGLLLSGRSVESKPFYPPLDQGDIDTFRAIAGLISALLQNRRVAALEEANRQIREQTERKSHFLANMSHELRTPMNAIIGFTRMVLRRAGDSLPERQKGNLERVEEAANRLLELINSLLDLSKIEAGRMDVTPKQFNVGHLVEGCCAEVSPLVEDKPNVRLTCEVSSEVGEAHTDKGRVRQIVTNLLSNAIKFTEAGEVAVRVEQEDASLVIAVSDTGAGIPADARDTIFEEFQQVAGSDPQRKGTGLGLPITKGFAELLGGSITVESEVGVGSTFTVRVPAIYAEANR